MKYEYTGEPVKRFDLEEKEIALEKGDKIELSEEQVKDNIYLKHLIEDGDFVEVVPRETPPKPKPTN